ncbi:MAG: hypothetical protein ACK40O_02270 [Allosphingosinicella sp.]
MDDNKNRDDRSEDRAETARRTDDSNVIDRMEDAPDFGGRSGGTLQRDIGTRAALNEAVGDGDGVTRVRCADKKEDADLPRFNQS